MYEQNKRNKQANKTQNWLHFLLFKQGELKHTVRDFRYIPLYVYYCNVNIYIYRYISVCLHTRTHTHYFFLPGGIRKDFLEVVGFGKSE